MAQFQLLRCSVALGGDTDNIVCRGRGSPILYPELGMIQFLHGEDAVTDVHVIGMCEMSQEEALTRLRVIYLAEEVAKVYPGARPRLPTMDRTIPLCTLPIHTPKPTRADNPDPILRPLDQFTMAEAALDEDDGDDMPGFDNPVPYGAEDEDPGIDETILGGPVDNRPKVEAQPQGRTSTRGQKGTGKDKASHLPDVAGRTKKHGENEHDRPKG